MTTKDDNAPGARPLGPSQEGSDRAMNTKHAEVRAQQRGIPPMIDQLLDLYGQEEHDGRGAIVLYLSKDSIRSMERDLGRRPVSRLAEWFDAYKVKSTDGHTITVGHRTRRLWRK